MKGMTTCKVCGRDFALMVEEHYVAVDPQKVGVLANLVNNDVALEYDAFDCPHCGCQNVMQGRKSTAFRQDECPCDYEIRDECDSLENETITHSCENCKYEALPDNKEPCKSCQCNFVNHFAPKKEEEKNE